MSSVARRVTLWGTGLLVASLALVGVGTGGILHLQQRRALDQALVAAAYGHAHPEVEEGWTSDHGGSPFDVWVAEPDDARIPAEALRLAERHEEIVYVDAGHERLVLLPVERDDEDDERELVIAASSRRLGLTRSIGPFVIVYGALSSVVVAAAAFAFARTTRRAFAPIARARREAEAVLGLGDGSRLTEEGADEIRSLLVAVNALLDRLDAAWAAQGRFTAEAAHELRTPVTVMLGELDVALRRERSPDEYAAILRSTRDEAARLGRIVQALTALARVDTGEAERQRELLRAGELADRALAAEAVGLAGAEVKVVRRADPELEGNAALLELALANLLRNAAAHAPGAAIEVTIDQEGPLAVFTVDDAGPGVPAGEREPLFERFARAPEARVRHAAGLGLGLSLSREIARRHGGDCALEASPLGGARARLTVRRSVGA